MKLLPLNLTIKLFLIGLLLFSCGGISQGQLSTNADMRLLQRYVNDNFNKAITFEDYVVFTCFEKFLCENCYRIPMDSIYRQVCNKYFSHAIYVVIDTPKTKTRLQQYAYPNIYFLYDKHHQMTKYGILQVVPQVMVFENKKIKYTELYNRK